MTFASILEFSCLNVNFENDSVENFQTVSPYVNSRFSVISNQQTDQSPAPAQGPLRILTPDK